MYATSASTQGGRVGVTLWVTRLSINNNDAWCGIRERRAYLGGRRSERLQVQAKSHSNASVARWLELTSRTSASWPALCATITPALGPELGASHVDQGQPGPEVHAHERWQRSTSRFFLDGGSLQGFTHKIPQSLKNLCPTRGARGDGI